MAYIVKSKSGRYLELTNHDGSPFTGWRWDQKWVMSPQKAEATALDSLKLAFEAKSGLTSCFITRPYLPHRISIIDTETGKEVPGYTEWQARQDAKRMKALR
jgi:hypothetical protein